MKSNYHKIYMLAMFLMVIGGLNWGIVGVFQINFMQKLISNPNHRKIIYTLIGLATLYIMIRRSTWLPFLGDSVIPCSFFEVKEQNEFTHIINLKLKPGIKVIYWAANSDDDYEKLSDVKKAYGKVTNSGMAIADENGIAKLKFKYPQAYFVKNLWKKNLPPHIHYRICKGQMMLGPVKKINL